MLEDYICYTKTERIRKPNEAKLDDGSIVSYDLCTTEENFNKNKTLYENHIMLGFGVIYSVNGTIQKSQTERYVFFRKVSIPEKY